MADLLQMAVSLVSAHAKSSQLKKEDITSEIEEVYAALKQIEAASAGGLLPPASQAPPEPAVPLKKAFGKDTVYCMICGKKLKTLGRHLHAEHGMTAGEYRKVFGVPANQPLASRACTEKRRQVAIELGLGRKG